jgi:hypothetical protein
MRQAEIRPEAEGFAAARFRLCQAPEITEDCAEIPVCLRIIRP